MTTAAPEQAEPTHPRPVSRAPRRGPTDLPFRFVDRGLAETLADERAEPDRLRDARIEAWQQFETRPIEPNQLYTQYLDLRAADLFDVRPYVRTANGPADDAPTALPDGVAGLIELVEDGVGALALRADLRGSGVILETFGAAIERDADAFRAELATGAQLQDDKLAALSLGFWSQGVRLVVPDGVKVDQPIVIRWAVGAPGRALVTRSRVTLGTDAEVSIVEELVGSPASVGGGSQALFTGTLEVNLAARSRLSVASLQELPDHVVVIGHRVAEIGDDAELHWALAQLGGRLVRSRVDNRLVGDRSRVEQVEIVFGGESQSFDLTSYTTHVGRDTTGDLLSKGALLDRARSYMKGLITIERSAIGTDSYLGEFGMNLSRATRSVAIPSLEIDQPDCRRAAHSSSVGPIDETQLFYLESRGIPPDEARKFIVLGFLEPVVARVPLESAQARLRELLEEKWATGLGADAGVAA